MPRYVVHGEVARVTLTVSLPPEADPEEEYRLYNSLTEGPLSLELEEGVRSEVEASFGEVVKVEELVTRRGSLEIIAVLTTSYLALKNINDFMDTLSKTARRIRDLLRSLLEGLPFQTWRATVTSEVTLGPAVMWARSAGIRRWQVDVPEAVMPYLLLSHLILTVTLVVLLFELFSARPH